MSPSPSTSSGAFSSTSRTPSAGTGAKTRSDSSVRIVTRFVVAVAP